MDFRHLPIYKIHWLSRILFSCSTLTSLDLFNHVCDLCLFSYPDVYFSVPVCDVQRTSFHLCLATSLFFTWVVSAHISAPYFIAERTHEL